MKAAAGLVIVVFSLTAAPPARFREHVIATDVKGGYQVLPLDVNRDGTPDLVALGQGMSELIWFQGPDWQRRVLATGMSRMINVAACSSDSEGYPEIVVAQAFFNEAKNSLGIVALLQRQSDPLQPWVAKEVDRIPTSHRLRCADIEGSRKPVVVNAPLTGAKAERPDFRDRVPLVYYRPGEWQRRLIGDEDEGVMHGVHVLDWDGDRREDILTASFLGIHVYSLGKNGAWRRTRIAKGDPSPWPKSGASDVTVGRLGKRRFLAAIEPWHGHQVALYTEVSGTWQRAVIDDTYVDGHTIVTGDLNGDGQDEIIAGYRGKGQSAYIYYAQDKEGKLWSRTALDEGGIAVAACAVADLNGDRRPDIACIGSATTNLKWYENVGN